MSATSLSDYEIIEPAPQGPDDSEGRTEAQITRQKPQDALPQKRHAARVAPQNTPFQEVVAIFTMLLIFGQV